MSPQQWSRAREIFAAAIQLPEHMIEGFLGHECAGDDELYKQVKAMVDAHFHSQPLDAPANEKRRDGARPVFERGGIVAKRYRIVRFVGRGGMGEVYEAQDMALPLNKTIAVKTLLLEIADDEAMINRFKQEIALSREVKSVHVCRVHDLGQHEVPGARPILFLTMEYVEGETLSERLKRTGPMSEAEALPLVKQMAAALDAAHEAGVIHRDFKPSNVILAGRGAVVTDFGLARRYVAPDDLTPSLSKQMIGTLDYMGPEILTGGAATFAADMYALGITVYRMVTGVMPFENRSPLEAAALRVQGPVPSPCVAWPGLDRNWERAILRALDAKPSRRFAKARDFAAALERPENLPSSLGEALRRWRDRLFTRRGALVFGGLCVIAAALFVFVQAGAQPSPAAEKWYEQGVQAIGDGDYYKAVRALEQSVKDSPAFPLSHAALAEAWFELDSPERADEEMLRATGPSVFGFHLDSRSRKRLEAVRDYVMRDYTSAIAIYKDLADSAAAAGKPRALVDLGRALERSKLPAQALERYQAAVRLDANYAGAFLRLAGVAAQLQQRDRWVRALASAETLFQAASDQEGLTQVYYERGANANREAHIAEAAEWLERARQSAVVTHNPYLEIRALYQLSAAAYQKGDTSAGQKLAEDAIHEARANNIEFLAGRGYYDLGNALEARGDHDKATEYFNEALRIARNYRSERLEANALYALGGIAMRTRGDEAGARQVEKALAWYEANHYPYEAGVCDLTLGRFERQEGNLVVAAARLNKRLQIARASHDDLMTALALSSLAFVLISQERFPDALTFVQEQLAMSRRMGDGARTAYGLESLAEIYGELGRFDEAAAAIEEGESAARGGKMDELLAYLEVERSRSLLLSGKTAEAAAVARRGVAAYESKYPSATGDLLQIQALARADAPYSTRLEWCERAWKMVQGSVTAQLSVRLTEAELRLRSGDARGAMTAADETLPAFERQQSDYSIFRAALIKTLGERQLGGVDAETAQKAAAALDRFKREFNQQAWVLFRSRPDLTYWEKRFRQSRTR